MTSSSLVLTTEIAKVTVPPVSRIDPVLGVLDTETVGGMGVDGRTLVTKSCFRYLQTLADLAWLRERLGGDLSGRKIAVSWAYAPSYAKPLSVPQGVIGLMTRLGMEVVLAHPEGYHLMPAVEEIAATLGISAKNVSVRLVRIRAKLARMIGETEETR